MEKLKFKMTFDAPREVVWDILWNDTTYREWTSVFSPGSHAKSDWKEGSKIFFLNEEGEGMVAIIAAKKAPELMSFKHLGEIHPGVEEMKTQADEWSEAYENYYLKSEEGRTELTVEMDSPEEYKDYFAKTWPQALEKLKSIVGRQKEEVVIGNS